jgi:hypothetical protein
VLFHDIVPNDLGSSRSKVLGDDFYQDVAVRMGQRLQASEGVAVVTGQ